MKDLNKKIGAGLLALGLVIGGLGLSGGLVAHADSIDEDPFAGLEGALIDESQFEKEFEEMLKEASFEHRVVDGREQIIAHFKNN